MAKANNRVVYILIAIIAVLVLAVAAAVGALVWKYSSLANGLDNLAACKTDGADEGQGINVQDLYPRFFRTPEEQDRFLKQYAILQNTRPPKPTYRPDNCSLYCPATNATFPQRKKRSASRHWFSDVIHGIVQDNSLRKKRQDSETMLDGPFYHACCRSYRFSMTPDTALSMAGALVDIVQLDFWKQYFIQESCEQVRTCENCQCEQPTPYVYEAVVYKDKDATDPEDMFEIVYIQVPGCCKCLNLGRRRPTFKRQ